MKRVLIALLLCFIFSSEIQAKKVQIGLTRGQGINSASEGGGCVYEISGFYSAYAHAHKSNELVLKALVGDRVTTVWDLDAFFPETTDPIQNKIAWPEDSSKWKADYGENWSLVWSLQSTKGKGRVIDAVEMTSGTCNP